MITASLVIYKNPLPVVEPVLQNVTGSCIGDFYVVDNSSLAGFEDELHKVSPQAIYIPSENRGFGAGHNIAIRKAMESGADYHVIVNPDISFAPGTIEKIIAFMEQNPDIGLVMPKTIYPDGRTQYNCKLVPSPLDLIFKRFLPKSWTRKRMDYFMMKWADYEKTMDVPYLCGCFMVFRMTALKKVGLFDERFFMYPEDIDITRRIYSGGFRTVYYPEAVVVHAHEAASYKNRKMLWIHIINMIKYFNKWGWLFDPERKRINQEIIAKFQEQNSK